MRPTVLLLALLAVSLVWAPGAARHVAAAPADDPDSGAELIGAPARAWSFDRWIATRPLELERLRGKVVLLRWFTQGCRFCTETLPALEALRRRPENRDLVVIGVFHPKPPRHVKNAEILKTARSLGFTGPIAVDERWSTLERYWLEGHSERNWTSVSFLIDRDGIVRWVHGGGEYHASDDPRHRRCTIQLRELEAALAAALAAKPTL
jgi:peroxiredoxin